MKSEEVQYQELTLSPLLLSGADRGGLCGAKGALIRSMILWLLAAQKRAVSTVMGEFTMRQRMRPRLSFSWTRHLYKVSMRPPVSCRADQARAYVYLSASRSLRPST